MAHLASLPRCAYYDNITGSHGGYSVEVNTSGCGPEDRGFESHYSPFRLMRLHQPFCMIAPVAQWIERLTSNQKVRGSSPLGRAFNEPPARVVFSS